MYLLTCSCFHSYLQQHNGQWTVVVTGKLPELAIEYMKKHHAEIKTWSVTIDLKTLIFEDDLCDPNLLYNSTAATSTTQKSKAKSMNMSQNNTNSK